MKNRIRPLVFTLYTASLLLCTACTGEISSPQTESIINSTPENTSLKPYNSSVTDTTTTTAKTEAISAPDEITYESEMLPVTITEMPEITIIDQIQYNDIVSQIGYTTPVDITTLADYEYTLEYTYSEDVTDEQRTNIISRNYTNIWLNYQYLGNNTADWIVFANYTLQVPRPSTAYYSKGFYVTDGIVGEEIFSCEGETGELYYDSDSIFFGAVCSENNGGLYRYNIMDKTITKLDSADWVRIEEITDDYILYTTGKCRIYNRSTGEVIKTDCYSGIQDGFHHYLHGDKFIFYTCPSLPDHISSVVEVEFSWLELDLITGEMTYLGEDEPAEISSETDSRIESDHFYVDLIRGDNYNKTIGISVEDKLTAETKKYSLISLAKQISSEDDYENGIYIYPNAVGNFIYFYVQDWLVVLDLRNGEAAMPIGSYRSSRIKMLDNSRMFLFKYGYEGTGAISLTIPD